MQGSYQARLLRASDAGEQRVTPLELFFDLVYVFTITQLSQYSMAMRTLGSCSLRISPLDDYPLSGGEAQDGNAFGITHARANAAHGGQALFVQAPPRPVLAWMTPPTTTASTDHRRAQSC